jgi:hypothetical protein
MAKMHETKDTKLGRNAAYVPIEEKRGYILFHLANDMEEVTSSRFIWKISRDDSQVFARLLSFAHMGLAENRIPNL